MQPPLRQSPGFTLVEALIGLTLATMVMLALFNTYIYLGRNLTRTNNFQALETKSRLAVAYLTRDLQMATAVSAPLDRSITLTTASGTVTYSYNSGTKTLSRVATYGAFQTGNLFAGECIDFNFNYYSTSGTSLNSTTATPVGIKQVSFWFTLQKGGGAQRDEYDNLVSDGTLVQLTTQSTRFILHNKQLPDGT